MTTPTQETGQPLDFTRPLELVCDGTEARCEALTVRTPGCYFVKAADGKGYWVDVYGCLYPTRPQIVRNRAEANTPVQGGGLVDEARAVLAQAVHDNGAHGQARIIREGGFGMVGSSCVIKAMLAFARHRIAHQPTTDAEAELAQIKAALADPNAVHVNLLAGHIARPSVEQIIHIYRPEMLTAALAHPPADKARIAELEAALETLSDQAAHVALGWQCRAPDLLDAMNELVVRTNNARAALENRSSKQEEGR